MRPPGHCLGRFHVAFNVLITCEQYWVVYAFLTVIESLINAAYWFRKYHCLVRKVV